MQGEITGFDHPIIGVGDLDAAGATFERLGFTMTPRGTHHGWGTANYCAMFPEDYLEILGLVDPTQFSNNLDTFLEEHGEGFLKLAFQAADAQACYRRLAAADVTLEVPKPLTRQVHPPEGAVDIKVKVLQIPTEAAPGVASVIVEHLTPERLRRPDWVAHPNGVVAVTSVTAVVDEPEAARDAFETLFGPGSAVTTDRTLTVHTPRGVIFLTAPDDLNVLHPEVEIDPPAPPALVAMEFAVQDLAATAALFEANRIEAGGDVASGLSISPARAHGVLLEFNAA